MKIDVKGKNPYDAVIEAFMNLVDGCDTYILHIRTGVLGDDNVIITPIDGVYWEFDTDWYEGGEVELLGYVRLYDLQIPNNC